MPRYNESGKAYHVKKAQNKNKKRKRELRREIRERRKKGLDTTALEIMLMLES
jgi:hypothetical protein